MPLLVSRSQYLFIDALSRVLSQYFPTTAVAKSEAEALDKIRDHPVRLLVYHVGERRVPLALLDDAKSASPGIPVLVLGRASNIREDRGGSRQRGAVLYMEEECSCLELVNVVARLLECAPNSRAKGPCLKEFRLGSGPLTPAQKRVTLLVAEGKRSIDIAKQLGLSRRTVESHRYAAMQALGAHTSTALVRRAQELGLLDDTCDVAEPGQQAEVCCGPRGSVKNGDLGVVGRTGWPK